MKPVSFRIQMDLNSIFESIPLDPREATKCILDIVTTKFKPLIANINTDIHSCNNDEDVTKLTDVFTLSLSQITKSLLSLFEIFRLEYSRLTILQESRQCNIERLSWCYERLITIEKHLKNKLNISEENLTINESLNVTNMYFVNWMDHTFEILSKLSDSVYRTDYKNSEELYNSWIKEMVECISSLHICVDELLLCAMTLCKYSLRSDQTIVKARCQVVLRETKALINELINEDADSTIKPTRESLKLPIMPTNINVLIDVLKDVLYILETNTNTALLSLLIHCFSSNKPPVEILKEHFLSDKDCQCVGTDDGYESCSFVKEFDLYNERLLQIGSFAISCSSDQNRILSLRSGLASLEALDPHLVPALMTSPESHHSTLLIKSWTQEVEEIKNSVFLIVDPTAFTEKTKQMMHQRLLEVLNETTYCNEKVCSVINIGCLLYDFFNVYLKIEPDALSQREKLLPLLANMDKVQMECKIVSNLLTTTTDFQYSVKTSTSKKTSLEKLHKRLKLFYTLVNRINSLLQPIDQDNTFENTTNEPIKNLTQTILNNGHTYVNSPRKINLTRSIFARTNVRSSTRNFPLAKLTKHLRAKNSSELNFSIELNSLLTDNGLVNAPLKKVREQSVLYNFSPIKNKSSLRKKVLNRHLQSVKKDLVNDFVDDYKPKESLMDENESLQLTQVLNEMNDMTSLLSTKKTQSIQQKANVTKININCDTTITKRIWNIPVNASTIDIPLDVDNVSNLTQPSNVDTLERIIDLDFVESKLSSLKSQLETSL